MRVLIVANEVAPPRGGMQSWLIDLVRAASKRNQVALVCPDDSDWTSLQDAGAQQCFSMKRYRCLLPEDSTFLGKKVLEAAREFQADVIHLGQAELSCLAPAISSSGLATVLSVHGNDLARAWLWLENRVEEKQERFREYLPFLDGVAAVSSFSGELLRRICPDQSVHIVPPAVDADRFFPGDRMQARRHFGLPLNRPILLSVGRLVARKGHGLVLSSLANTSSWNPLYVVAGKGPEAESLVVKSEQLGIEDQVLFLGDVSVADLPILYRTANVFVMPAFELQEDLGLDYEGFGIVYLEAAASGIPCVGARSGGVPDAVSHGETGLLVSPQDSRALAEALNELLSNPERARELGDRGLRRVREQFTLKNFGDRYEAVYREACRKRSESK